MNKTEQHPCAKYINLRIESVFAILGTKKLYITWKNADEAVVDFSDVITQNKWFKPLQDLAKFQKAKHVDWGSGIEWDNGAGIGSDEVRWMADQQDSVLYKDKKKIA